MAEAVFAHDVRQAGLEDKIQADSAGTGHWHVGESPHSGTLAVLRQRGISYRHQARVLVAQDLIRFDYILTMDDSNLAAVRTMLDGYAGPAAVVRPFLDFLPGGEFREVPDPYYTGDFESVLALVSAASDGLLTAIRRDHHL